MCLFQIPWPVTKAKVANWWQVGGGPEEKASVLYYLVFNIWYKEKKDVETYPLNIIGEVKNLEIYYKKNVPIKIYDLYRLLTMFW